MTEVSAELIVAISSLISIVCATVGSFYVSRLAARKDTIKELRDKILAQEVIIKQLNDNYDKLYSRLLEERDTSIRDRDGLKKNIDDLQTEIRDLRDKRDDNRDEQRDKGS